MASVGPIIVLVLSLIASIAIVASRFRVRIRTVTSFDAGDYTILASLALQCSLAMIGVVQLVNTENPDRVYMNRLFYCGTFLYFGTLWVVKVSINLFQLKLTSRLGQVHTAARVSLYYTYMTGFIILMLQIFGCWPISRRFTSDNIQGCDIIQNSAIFWICAAFNFSTDIILIVLPYPALMNISERRVRAAICVVFSLAGSILIMTTIRAVLITVAPATNTSVILVLSNLECGVCVAISAVPGISNHFTTKYLNASSGGGNKSSVWSRTPGGKSSGWSRTPGDKSSGMPGGGSLRLPRTQKSFQSRSIEMDGTLPNSKSTRARDAETESEQGLENRDTEGGMWVSTGLSPSPSMDGEREGRLVTGPGQILKKTTIQMEVSPLS